MDIELLIGRFWSDVAAQDAETLPRYFLPDALIRWHCSNECFTVPQYVRANCEYPGRWRGEVERFEHFGPLVVTATRITELEEGLSFHVVSFFHLEGDRIAALDEYWGDDSPPPQWRQELELGRPIRENLT